MGRKEAKRLEKKFDRMSFDEIAEWVLREAAKLRETWTDEDYERHCDSGVVHADVTRIHSRGFRRNVRRGD